MKSEFYFNYRILGLMPEVPEGHEFRSMVPDLENRADLWERECPYNISKKSRNHVTVEKIE